MFTNKLNDQLKFYEVTWSPTTTLIKSNQFLKDSEMDKSGNRLPFNQNVKKVMDKGFGDAALYLNPAYRTKMQEPILQTITIVDQEATNADDQIVFVTHSLGSKMTLDTMIENSNNPAVQSLEGKTTDIIMLANQLPLLDLGTETNELAWAAGKGESQTSSTLFKFLKAAGEQMRFRNRTIANGDEVRVVAATDPNDALSFPLEEGTTNVSGVQISFSNIYKYNDCGIFDVFFTWPPFLEYPVTAHIGYLENRKLIEKLVEGFPKKGGNN
jgi:hypothetical protein